MQSSYEFTMSSWEEMEGYDLLRVLLVVGARPVDVGRRQHHHLGHLVGQAVLEQLGGAADVPRVGLGGAGPRRVHQAHVDQRADVAGAEDVARLLRAQVDLVVLDVLGAAEEGAPIEADHVEARVAMEPAGEQAAQPARDAGDHDLARLTRRHACGP